MEVPGFFELLAEEIRISRELPSRISTSSLPPDNVSKNADCSVPSSTDEESNDDEFPAETRVMAAPIKENDAEPIIVVESTYLIEEFKEEQVPVESSPERKKEKTAIPFFSQRFKPNSPRAEKKEMPSFEAKKKVKETKPEPASEKQMDAKDDSLSSLHSPTYWDHVKSYEKKKSPSNSQVDTKSETVVDPSTIEISEESESQQEVKKPKLRFLSFRKSKRSQQKEDAAVLTSEKKSPSTAKEDGEEASTSTDLESTSVIGASAVEGADEADFLVDLVHEHEVEVGEEVDELITTVLYGADKEKIEKELNDRDIPSVDLQKEAESRFARLVDKIDVCGPCGLSCKDVCHEEYYDIRSSRSSDPSRQEISRDPLLNSANTSEADIQPNMMDLSEEVVLDVLDIDSSDDDIAGDDDSDHGHMNDDDTNTKNSLDDDCASLASEYDDFDKAMAMLKNRAMCQGVSEGQLLQRIQKEQMRRESLGLSSTMVEL